MLVLGAWWGKKPEFSCFLDPLSVQLNDLKAHGHLILNHQNQPVQVKFRLLTVTADNPAKDALEKLKPTNCGLCDQARKVNNNTIVATNVNVLSHVVADFVANRNGHLTVATFPVKDPPAHLRTNESMLADGEQATPEHASHGIKGPIPLALVDDVDLRLPVDYLHDVCLRHANKQLRLWFDSTHRNEAFSVRPEVDAFDRKMKGMKAPAFITRTPKPFSKINHWKGTSPFDSGSISNTHENELLLYLWCQAQNIAALFCTGARWS